jgi:hypothetical protein
MSWAGTWLAARSRSAAEFRSDEVDSVTNFYVTQYTWEAVAFWRKGDRAALLRFKDWIRIRRLYLELDALSFRLASDSAASYHALHDCWTSTFIQDPNRKAPIAAREWSHRDISGSHEYVGMKECKSQCPG